MANTWFIVLVYFTSLAYCDVDLLRNINNVILTDIQVLQEKENKQDFLGSMIDRLDDSHHDHHVELDVVGQFRSACGNPLNRSVCIESLNNQCGDIPALLRHLIENFSADINVTDLFPAFVLFESIEDCNHRTGKPVRVKPTTAQAWGYGIGFVALICTIANIGAIMTPFLSKTYFQRILLFCVALAVGTLAGTGMLVLIPESMHLGDEHSPVPDYHLKMITVLAGIYFFYVAERLLKIFLGRDHKETAVIGNDVKVIDERQTMVAEDCEKYCCNDEFEAIPNFDMKQGKPPKVKKTKLKTEVSTVAWMVLMGDALHNFVDGIAIGAAFTENVYLGVSVSLAIICEELPHELGDIAILLHAGLSMKKALFFNFLAAIMCFLGLVIGILVGKLSGANEWIFAIAGGIFVYIALVDMLPEMSQQYNDVVNKGIESPLTAFLIQNVGLILGFVIIVLMVLFLGHACA